MIDFLMLFVPTTPFQAVVGLVFGIAGYALAQRRASKE